MCAWLVARSRVLNTHTPKSCHLRTLLTKGVANICRIELVLLFCAPAWLTTLFIATQPAVVVVFEVFPTVPQNSVDSEPEGGGLGFRAGLSLSFTFHAPAWLVAFFAAAWLAAVAWLSLLPVAFAPKSFAMPGNPFTASLAMLANLHLMCKLLGCMLH